MPQIIRPHTSKKITSSANRAKSAERVAEIDGDAECAAGQRRRNPDPEAAERGGKEHGRDIGREKYVRAGSAKGPTGPPSTKPGSRSHKSDAK